MGENILLYALDIVLLVLIQIQLFLQQNNNIVGKLKGWTEQSKTELQLALYLAPNGWGGDGRDLTGSRKYYKQKQKYFSIIKKGKLQLQCNWEFLPSNIFILIPLYLLKVYSQEKIKSL